MLPDTILIREYGQHLLDNCKKTTLKPDTNHKLIDEIPELKDLLDETDFSSGLDFVDTHLDGIIDHLQTLVDLDQRNPPKAYCYHERGNSRVFIRYDRYQLMEGMDPIRDLVRCLINWNTICEELCEELTDSDFEVFSCLGMRCKLKLEHAFITRPQGGPDGGLDFGGIYEMFKERRGLVGSAKNITHPLSKNTVNAEIKSWESELRPFLLGEKDRPQSLPDLPSEFMEVGEWRYMITAQQGMGKRSQLRIKEATAIWMDLEQILWEIFQDLLENESAQYFEFFNDEEPWEYVPNSMVNWIRGQKGELIHCPP